MGWNYRVFRTQYQIKFIREKEPHLEEYFTIREAYYPDELNQEPVTAISASDCAVFPSGETADELWKDLQRLQLAFQKPTLTPHDIPGYQYEKDEIPYDDTTTNITTTTITT